VTLDESEYTVTLPVGPSAGYGRLRFVSSPIGTPPFAPPVDPPVELPGAEPIRITYDAGYVTNPPQSTGEIPMDLQQAMLLLIGEFYAQRSLAVIGTSTVPAIVQATAIFQNYRPY